jgi:plasmid stabilization system protein ParE
VKWVVFIRPGAERDLVAARDWYDAIDPKLGDRFLDEVAEAMVLLESDPEIQSFYYLNFRRVLLRRFPYKLFYQVIGGRVIVFRILHAKQCHEWGLGEK